MSWKKALLLVIVLVCTTVNVFADLLDVALLESQDEVEAGTTAEFTLKITNNGLERDVFSIEADELNVYPFSEFAAKIEAKPFQVKLNAEESAISKVLIKTRDIAPPNRFYDSTVIVASVIHPEVKKTIILKTYIASAKNIIEIVPQLPTKITPGKETKVPVRLKNRSRLTLENIEIVTATDVPKIADPIIITLQPQEEKEETIIINIAPAATPGMKKMTIAAYEKDQLRGSFVADVEILPKDRVEEDREVKRGFLSSTTTITRKNRGNTASEQRVEAAYNLIQRIFSSMTPKPETELNKVVWKFTLEPGEKKTIEIYSNYRPALYGFIVVALFTAILIFSIERSVVIKKRIFHGKEVMEGVKEYKVFLLARNGKKYTINDVKVMDLVSNILELTADFGSLKPDRVQHGERTTRLLWNVIKLDPGEERVFSYKIRKKSSIIGDVILPVAIMQYVDNKEKFVQVQSIRGILD
ncbi:hypothetical protein HYS50_02100 [Candidatus Woesearchaeota archaeon]|nr:hypothetical protein [Candidatus Woesearchaeota archaeon]